MKYTLFAAAAALMAAAGSLALPTAGPVQASAAAAGSIGDVYRLRTSATEGSCAVSRGALVSERVAELRVGTECETLVSGLGKARFWEEREDGSVAFTENGLDPIVTFSIADGIAYESFAPGEPVVSLAAE